MIGEGGRLNDEEEGRGDINKSRMIFDRKDYEHQSKEEKIGDKEGEGGGGYGVKVGGAMVLTFDSFWEEGDIERTLDGKLRGRGSEKTSRGVHRKRRVVSAERRDSLNFSVALVPFWLRSIAC